MIKINKGNVKIFVIVSMNIDKNNIFWYIL